MIALSMPRHRSVERAAFLSKGLKRKAMAAPRRWVNRPEGSTWGDFGPDDQLGRLNLITHAKVLQGIAEVREGKSFCLSLPLD